MNKIKSRFMLPRLLAVATFGCFVAAIVFLWVRQSTNQRLEINSTLALLLQVELESNHQLLGSPTARFAQAELIEDAVSRMEASSIKLFGTFYPEPPRSFDRAVQVLRNVEDVPDDRAFKIASSILGEAGDQSQRRVAIEITKWSHDSDKRVLAAISSLRILKDQITNLRMSVDLREADIDRAYWASRSASIAVMDAWHDLSLPERLEIAYSNRHTLDVFGEVMREHLKSGSLGVEYAPRVQLYCKNLDQHSEFFVTMSMKGIDAGQGALIAALK